MLKKVTVLSPLCWLIGKKINFFPRNCLHRFFRSRLLNGVAEILLATVLSVILSVTAVMGCALCRNRSGFKDFTDAVELETPPAFSVVEDESMFAPPFESVPNTPSKVEFESLPEVKIISGQINKSLLYPKICRIDRMKMQNSSDISKCEFARNQLQYLKEMGTGWFGKAILGEAAKISVGMKRNKVVVRQLNEESSKEDQALFMEEIRPYRDIDHPNVLKLLGICTEISPYLAILEYFPSGDMKHFLRNHENQKTSLSEQGLLLNFVCDLVTGLKCIHNQDYVHNDFALRNCIVTADMSVKIGDYGVSEYIYKEDYFFTSTEAVPIRWCAPETIDFTGNHVSLRKTDKQANIWTFGVVLWELLEFARLPYNDLNDENVLEYVISRGQIRLAKPLSNVLHTDKLYELMCHCWLEVDKRPDIAVIHHALTALRSHQNSDEFDSVWNKMLPKRSPVIVKADSPSSNDRLNDRCFSTEFIPSQLGPVGKISEKSQTINESDYSEDDTHHSDLTKSVILEHENNTAEDDILQQQVLNGDQRTSEGQFLTSTPIKKPFKLESPESDYNTPDTTMGSSSNYDTANIQEFSTLTESVLSHELV